MMKAVPAESEKLNRESIMENENAASGSQPSGERTAPEMSQPSLVSREAAREAVGTNLPAIELNRHGKPKGKPGRPIKSGKWAGRGKLPVGTVGNGPSPLLVEDSNPGLAPAQSVAIDFEPGEAPFDKVACEPYADLILDFLKDINAEIVKQRVQRGTGNAEVAQLAVEKSSLGPVQGKIIRTGILDCAEKYNIDLTQFPEFALFGGLVVWQIKVNAGVKSAIAEYLRLRPNREAKP